MRAVPNLSVYLVTDEGQCRLRGRSVLQTVEAAVDGGVTCVQLRAKDTDGGPFLAQVRAVAGAVGDRVPVIVNDRVDVFLAARDLGAPVAGVHVGQSDLPAGVVRALIGDDACIGLSAATPDELRAARAEGACDYVGIGVVHDTATKTDAPRGLGADGSHGRVDRPALRGHRRHHRRRPAGPARGWPGRSRRRLGHLHGRGSAGGRRRPTGRLGRGRSGMTRSEARSRTVTALTIAGSDPSGGAGVQADLKAMSALGAYGMSVITALTAQSTRGVTGVRAVPVDFVRLQLDTLLDDIVPDATKIGMLATAELADAVGEYLPGLSRTVLDPVMVATSGDRLLDEEAVGAVRRLCGVADLITPNLHEAAVLLGEEAAGDTGALRAQARRLVEQGAQRVLVKGGHFAAGTAGTADAPESVDVYADADSTVLLRGRRVMTKNTHGTGCTLSSAIASLRPRRATWLEAVRDAKVYLTGAIEHADALGVGHGHGPVHHFHRLWAQNDED